jgi:hypothetical protein
MGPTPVTDITVNASAIFTPEQQAQLRVAFGVPDIQDFKAVLEGLATAALVEYRDTFFGPGMPTRAEDFQQRRLLLLLLHVFKQFPNERQVAALLKLMPSRARSLLSVVNVRYVEDLRPKIQEDVVRVLKNDSKGRKNYRNVFIWSATTRQAIDDLVDELNGQKSTGTYLDRLARHPTINGVFEIGEPTLKELKKSLGI